MSGSLFESYNARSYEPAQVAERFVFSRFLSEASGNTNTLIVGPRGSGKTTLLKMLTLPALMNWQDERRETILSSIDYIAVYVPSDFTWNPAFRGPENFSIPPQVEQMFTMELFSAHIKLALCETIEFVFSNLNSTHLRGRFSISSDETAWRSLIEEIKLDWKVSSDHPGFFGLRRGIHNQVSQMQQYISLSALQGDDVKFNPESFPFIGFSVFDQLRSFSDLWKSLIGGHNKWALCLDELEIAPRPVKDLFLRSYRSFDQSFRVKLSASPNDEALVEVSGKNEPSREHDYFPVRLYDRSQDEILKFSTGVFEKMCQERYGKVVPPHDLFGWSIYLEDNEEARPTPRLSADGLYARQFRELALKDKSFAELLSERKIDLNRLDSGSENRKAQIRKLISTVVWRNEFLFKREDNQRVTTRRYRSLRGVSKIYSGSDTLFRICEGNPRLLIGIIQSILADHESPRRKVSDSRQTAAIQRAITSQMLLLSTLGDDQASPKGVTLVELIHEIGAFFRHSLFSEKFNIDPVYSFTISEKISPRIKDLIGLAINQGAIVINPGNGEAPGSFQDSRMRLSYLLGAHFHLPPIKGRSVTLNRILVERGAKTSRPEQLVLNSLLGDDDD